MFVLERDDFLTQHNISQIQTNLKKIKFILQTKMFN